ncbi:MAG: protein kinase [Verrucomicrobiales bacterium]|nr:protein kinase [Verrucomicrobiales bacterium]
MAAAFPELEVLSLLGSGGMGFVYHARDRASSRDVALKLLPGKLAADPAFVERFNREARTLARLDHPGIVRVFHHGQSGGFCHLTMEYVDGANLRQVMRAGRFTPAQALQIIPGICDALQYAHAHGVLHRDIKPENILLDSHGRVRIADFGIAKLLDEPADAQPDITLTRTGHRLGTPHYMAPEQVERPDLVDHRADIYSLGVVFYELLTGELPLGRFPAPSTKAYLDARVDEIVFRALAKERELRQQSAGQVKDEVEGLRQPPEPPTPAGPGMALATASCFASTPEHLRTILAQFYIYSDGGTVSLEAERLVFAGREGTTVIPLSDILGIGLGEYPRLTKPTGLSYIALRHREGAAERILLLTPYTSMWNATWTTNTLVQEWHRKITEQIARIRGHVPPVIDPALLRVAGPWRFFAIVAGVAATSALLLPRVLPWLRPTPLEFLLILVGFAGFALAVAAITARGPRRNVKWPSSALGGIVAFGLALCLTAGLAVASMVRRAASGAHPFPSPNPIAVDPITSQPLVIFGPIDATTDSGAVVAASPSRSESGALVRTVALGDGSVHTVSEAEFLTRLLGAPATQRPAVAEFLMGPKIPGGLAEDRLRNGAAITRSSSSAGEFHELSLPLPEAFLQLAHGDPSLTMFILHALLRMLPEDPDREFLFWIPSPGNPPRRDLHLRTQSRNGGLLALLAILAARAQPPQPAILAWSQDEGRKLWTNQSRLTLCERRLDGESDQTWEEIFVDTSEVLALRPGQQPQFIVIRHTKNFGVPPQTNVVAFPWPRTP